MKKFLINTAVVAALVSMPLGLAGCKDKKETKDYSLSASQFYAMGLATGANYLNSLNPSGQELARFSLSNSTKASLETYVGMFGGFMENGIHPTKSNTTESDGDYDLTYEKKLSIKLGEETYTLFYNETLVRSDTEYDEDETEQETHTFLSGVAVSNDKTYYMVGGETVESETENGRTETEVETKMILSDLEITVTNNNIKTAQISSGAKYVKIEEEREDDEIEYKYTTSEDPLNTINIEWENEDGKEELEVNLGAVEYQIRLSSNNKYKVVEIKNGVKTTFYMEKQAGEFIYTTANGQTL